MRMRGLVFTQLAAALLLGLLTAADAGAADRYGAIAYSNTTGAFGDAREYPSKREAEEHALSECTKRGRGCKLMITLHNECGALATGANYGFGFAAALTRTKAEGAALGFCRKNTSDCKVAVWTCTSR
jgi:hypothetical protein